MCPLYYSSQHHMEQLNLRHTRFSPLDKGMFMRIFLSGKPKTISSFWKVATALYMLTITYTWIIIAMPSVGYCMCRV